MANDLQEIIERLDYCDQELAELNNRIESYVKAAREMRTIRRYVPVKGTAVEMRLTNPPPTGIRVKAGSIVHEARSCLDALACMLALRNNKDTNGVCPSSEHLAQLAA